MDRRRFLTGALAGAVVIGFDPVSRQWIPAAAAAPPGSEPLPAVDGVVTMADPALDAASTDEGYLVTQRPWAVLRPASVRDIATMILFCRRHGVPVASRGQAHTVFGQSLADDGLVIEISTLDTIHSIGATTADVDAGVLWKDLFAQAFAAGVTPPVYTGYTQLTVGGTLSVGGIGILPRAGAQVERVRRIQVVTGEGRIAWCDDTTEPALFHAALAGVGQYGVITRAVLDVVPAQAEVRQWNLLYADPHLFFRDLRTMLARNEFDCVYGQIAFPALALAADPSPLVRPISALLPLIEAITGPIGRGVGSVVTVPPLPLPTPWVYLLNVAKYHQPGQQPNGWRLLRGMSDLALLRQSHNSSYLDFVYRVDVLIDTLKAASQWNGVPHPWVDVFMPDETVEDFVAETFAGLRFDDVGLAGFGLLFPIQRSRITRPSLPLPSTSTDWVYLFDVLTSAPLPGPNTAFVQAKLARNRSHYERARSRGGKLYSISAVDMQPADWAGQYGAARYAELTGLKNQYDPDRILTPGVRMF